MLFVFTDNNALRCLVSKRNVERKNANRIMALQEYQFRHLKVNLNVVAEHISSSRLPTWNDLPIKPNHVLFCKDLLSGRQTSCSSARRFIVKRHNNQSHRWRFSSKWFFLDQGVLYKKNKNRTGHAALLVTLSSLIRGVLRVCHVTPNGGRQGINKTEAKVRQSHWWPGLAQSCEINVRSCVLCQLHKPPTGFPVG